MILRLEFLYIKLTLAGEVTNAQHCKGSWNCPHITHVHELPTALVLLKRNTWKPLVALIKSAHLLKRPKVESLEQSPCPKSILTLDVLVAARLKRSMVLQDIWLHWESGFVCICALLAFSIVGSPLKTISIVRNITRFHAARARCISVHK